MHDDFEVVRPGQQPEWAKRIERKLDTLIAALAEDGDEPPLKSLDDGRTYAARDGSRGLG